MNRGKVVGWLEFPRVRKSGIFLEGKLKGETVRVMSNANTGTYQIVLFGNGVRLSRLLTLKTPARTPGKN